MSITTQKAQLDIKTYRPELNIDQSKAQAAYTGGPLPEMLDRRYSSIQQIFLQGIAKRVEDGNRLAEFFKPGNTIGNIVGSRWNDNPFAEFRGPASSKNVDIRFDIRSPEATYRPASVDIEFQVHKPEIEYRRGSVEIYMKQYASVQFIPPELDTTM